jgi:Ca2+-binding RTX toxin-like protein
VSVDLSAGTASDGQGGVDTLINIQSVNGSPFDDTLTGNAAENLLRGFQGTDTLNGGAGNDVLDGGLGADALDGGGGSDTASYASAIAGITARLDLGFGVDDGGAFDTYTSIEDVTGSGFADVLVGKPGEANVLSGGGDNDTIYGEGIDTIDGGAGNDVFFGGQGSGLNIDLAASSIETVWGSFVADVMDGSGASVGLTMIGQGLTGGANADTMIGGSGDDFVYYRAGDIISGGAGSDWAVATLSAEAVTLDMAATGFENAWGSTSADTITAAGSATSAVLVGDAGNDVLTGGNAGDFLYGFGDNDTLNGGAGNDNLIGGAGADTFAFAANWGIDIVWDWENGVEQFDLTGSGATGFGDLTVDQDYLGSGNALITFNGNQILVVGGANAIDASDFLI